MRRTRLSLLRLCLGFAFGAAAVSTCLGSSAQPSTPSISALSDSSAGTPIDCIDMRTGGPFVFRAQRLWLSGVRDRSWAPDSSRLCLGSMEGVAYERVPDGSGGAYIGWVDSRLELTDIYLQHFTAGGSSAEGWPDGGLPVCTAENSQYHLSMCPDGSGGVLLVWQDFRGGTSDIYASRITQEGHLAAGWQADGIPICTASGEQGRPSLARSPDGAFIAWEDHRSGHSAIYVKRVGGDGAPASGWAAEGESLAVATPAFNPRVVSDSSGHCGVIWSHRGESGEALLVAPLDEQSSFLASVSTLTSDAESISAPFVVRLGAHELLVSWSEWRSSGASARVQKIDLAVGIDLKWASGGAVLCSGSLGVDPAVLAIDGAGGIVGAWVDFDEDTDGDIYAKRLLADGSPDTLWPAQGVAVSREAGNQYRPSLVPGGSNGIIATWGDGATGGNASFFALRADPEGLQAALLSAVAKPGHVHIVWHAPRALGGPFDVERRIADAAWSPVGRVTVDKDRRIVFDDRAIAEGVRAAYRLLYRDSLGTVFFLPVELVIPIAPLVLNLAAVISQGRTHSLTVLFSLPHGPPPELEVLDVQGRRVERQRLDGLDAGEHRYTLSVPAALASGVYFVRLTQGATTRVAKTVYVR